MSGPLSGIRVVDFGTYAVGPSASAYMGYLGAEVVRIENPAGEGFMDLEPTMGGMACSYINANMQKKSVVLNLRDPGELDSARQLVRTADVFIENRISGVADRLGLGYEDVSRVNPRIIYVSMPGFADNGPYARRPSMDMEVQALSGFASIQGREGGPAELFRVYAHLDHTTGLALVQAAVLALIERRRTNKGRHIKVGFFSSSMFLQMTRIAEFRAGGSNLARSGSASSLIAPSQSFPCPDGYVNVSAPNDEAWSRLCDALDLADLKNDPRFSTNDKRMQNRAELAELISRKTQEAPVWWWLVHLRREGIPCGAIYTFDDIKRDPQFRQRGLIVDVETAWGPVMRGGHPWRFSETPCSKIEGTHKPGADSEAVLSELAEGAERDR